MICTAAGGNACVFDARKPVMQALIEHPYSLVVTENIVFKIPGVAWSGHTEKNCAVKAFQFLPSREGF